MTNRMILQDIMYLMAIAGLLAAIEVLCFAVHQSDHILFMMSGSVAIGALLSYLFARKLN